LLVFKKIIFTWKKKKHNTKHIRIYITK